ncbi:snake venom 5'-nucleotidase-like [Branchiostoma lanceolatum]|uniref:snake venom 5'-nucleotidase-like n=1 Tax=Branchiostoma lanceolatum TaxID=7740 RepID=UPI003452AED4
MQHTLKASQFIGSTYNTQTLFEQTLLLRLRIFCLRFPDNTMWGSLVLLPFLLSGNIVLSFNLSILHTNDVHSRIEEANAFGGRCRPGRPCFGGVARLASKVQEVRSTDDNVILLDAGDWFQGTLWYYFFRSSVLSQFTNELRYDAMTIGNHEFDDGVEELVTFLRDVNFPVVSANINTSREPELRSLFSPSVVLNVSGEYLGIVGYTTTDTPFISDSGNNLVFSAVVASVQAEVDKLLDQGVNKIIALGHAGILVDQEVASRVRGVDIVVGGHTNTFLYTGPPPSTEEPYDVYPIAVYPDHATSPVLVVQAYAFGKYLGHLRVTFDDDGKVTQWAGNPILLDDTVPKDANISAEVARLAASLANKTEESVGTTQVLLGGECKSGECNIGNLITNSMVHHNIKHPDETSWNDVAIAVLNSGGIRSIIDQGSITVGDVVGCIPFENTIDIVELRGEDVLRMLEHSAILIGHPRFLQVSGLRVVYDKTKAPGHRVVKVDALCSTGCLIPEYRPLDPTASYKIIMPTFLANGGDGYNMIAENKTAHYIPGDLDTDILIEYIKTASPVSVGLEGRIRVINSTQEEPQQPCPTMAAPSTGHFFTTDDDDHFEDEPDDVDKNIVALAVGIPAALVLTIAVIACVIWGVKRSRNKFTMTNSNPGMAQANPVFAMEKGING